MIKIPTKRELTPEEQAQFERNKKFLAEAEVILDECRKKGYFSADYYEDFFPNLRQDNTNDIYM